MEMDKSDSINWLHSTLLKAFMSVCACECVYIHTPTRTHALVPFPPTHSKHDPPSL